MRGRAGRGWMGPGGGALILLVLVISLTARQASPSQGRVVLSSDSIPQGGLAIIRVLETEAAPDVTWMGRQILISGTGERRSWYGFLGVDLGAAPGDYPLLVKFPPGGREERLRVAVVGKDYGVRKLSLPKKMVDLDPATLARVKKEARIMKKLWAPTSARPLWQGAFTRPVPGEIVGPFGRKSVINGQPRSPHSGVDLRGKKGTPVRATNRGRIVFTGNHFFTGKTVVIDHGGGIQSMYFHLDRILVDMQEKVEKDQEIGRVGSTGRSTGPHLHWGVRANGARVDPMALMAVSAHLEG